MAKRPRREKQSRRPSSLSPRRAQPSVSDPQRDDLTLNFASVACVRVDALTPATEQRIREFAAQRHCVLHDDDLTEATLTAWRSVTRAAEHPGAPDFAAAHAMVHLVDHFRPGRHLVWHGTEHAFKIRNFLHEVFTGRPAGSVSNAGTPQERVTFCNGAYLASGLEGNTCFVVGGLLGGRLAQLLGTAHVVSHARAFAVNTAVDLLFSRKEVPVYHNGVAVSAGPGRTAEERRLGAALLAGAADIDQTAALGALLERAGASGVRASLTFGVRPPEPLYVAQIAPALDAFATVTDRERLDALALRLLLAEHRIPFPVSTARALLTARTAATQTH